MSSQFLKYFQICRVYSGQLDRGQRFAIVKPPEKLPYLIFRHIFIVVNSKVIILNPILRPLRQLFKRHAAEVLCVSIIICHGGEVSSQCIISIQKSTNGIAALLSVQTVIHSVLIPCKVHSGNGITIKHTVNEKALFPIVPHKPTLHRIVEVYLALVHLISQSLCRPLNIKTCHFYFLLIIYVVFVVVFRLTKTGLFLCFFLIFRSYDPYQLEQTIKNFFRTLSILCFPKPHIDGAFWSDSNL